MLIHGFEVDVEDGVEADVTEVLLRPGGRRLLTEMYREMHFVRWFAHTFDERAAVVYPDVLPRILYDLYDAALAEHEAAFDHVPWKDVWDRDLVACGCLEAKDL